VVVGEDAAASKNLVYVTSSNVEQESYDKTTGDWTWTRKVASDGEEIVLKEVGDSLTYLKTNSDPSKGMKQYNWYQVKYNANGEVIGVQLASAALDAGEFISDSSKIQASANEYDTVLYSEGVLNNQPTMKGSSLYAKTTDNTGVLVADDVKIVLTQYVKNKVTTTYETGAKNLQTIIETLNENHSGKKYNYTIGMIIEDGIATTVTIKDDSNDYTVSGSGNGSSDVEGLGQYQSIDEYASGYFYIYYYDEGQTPSQVREYVTEQLESYVGLDVKNNAYVSNNNTFYVTLDDGSAFGARATVEVFALVAIKVNGTTVDYVKKDEANEVATLTGLTADTYYTTAQNVKASGVTADSDGDGQTTNGTDTVVLTDTGKTKATVKGTFSADTNYKEAYAITLTGVGATYVDGAGDTQSMNSGYLIQKGTALTVTRTAAADAKYHQLVVTPDGGSATKVGTPVLEDGTHVTTYTYEVSGKATLSESTGYRLMVDGNIIGVYEANEIATFHGYGANQLFARDTVAANESHVASSSILTRSSSKLTVAGATDAGKTYDDADGTYYKVLAADDSNSDGTIELISVIKVTTSADVDTSYTGTNDKKVNLTASTAYGIKAGVTLEMEESTASSDKYIKKTVDGTTTAIDTTTKTESSKSSADYTTTTSEKEVTFTLTT
jgi:hypothetical protein